MCRIHEYYRFPIINMIMIFPCIFDIFGDIMKGAGSHGGGATADVGSFPPPSICQTQNNNMKII